VPFLIESLTNEAAPVRSGAAEALGWIGPDADRAVRALVEALRDPDETVRKTAARALRQIRPEGAEDLIRLTDDLRKIEKKQH
jgi:HEAT repeat protein